MKQRITIEQLKELSDVQKERLREWWKPIEGDFVYVDDIDNGLLACGTIIDMRHEQVTYAMDRNWIHTVDKHLNAYPLLSIGQMIEFLREDYLNIIVGSKKGMSVVAYGPESINVKSDELCDALWQAVKQVL